MVSAPGLLEQTWSSSETDGYYVCVSWRTEDCVYRLSGDELVGRDFSHGDRASHKLVNEMNR